MSDQRSPFDEVKERVDLAEFLQTHCGAYFVPDGGGAMKSLCPFHDENTESFKIRESSNGDYWIWSCHGRCQRFNETVIDAAMIQEELLTPIEAVDYLNELYSLGIDLNNPGYQEFKERVHKAKQEVARVKDEMASDSKPAKQARAYLHGRALTDETIDFFELAVDTHSTKAGRIAIPIKEKGGHEIAVVTRALFDSFPCASCGADVRVEKELIPRRSKWNRLKERGEDPGYDFKACPHCEAPPSEARVAWLFGQHPKYDNPTGYEKSKVLYNLHTARKALKDDLAHGYYVSEGYADAWACWQAGQKACSSYNGASLSDWQAGELTKWALHYNKPVILLPDIGDASGAGDTGLVKNLKVLREQPVAPEVQVLHSYGMRDPDAEGVERPINDFAELLQLRGMEEAARVLEENRWSSTEFEIRGIVAAVNQKTGKPADSKPRQMEMVAEVLGRVQHMLALDHLAEHLAEVWDIDDPTRVRTWMESQIQMSVQLDNQALMADTRDSIEAYQEYAKNHDPIPLGYDSIDACLPGGGLGLKQIALVLGKSGTGKSLQNGTFCLTATGWKKIEEIVIGETMIDPTGGATKVLGVFPQGERDAYRMSFSDGTSIVCDREHLWKIRTKRGWHVRTAGEIVDAMACSEGRLYIPVMEPAQFAPQAELPVDPYILGALLGDGCFTKNSIMLTSVDPEIVAEIERRLPEGMKVTPSERDDFYLVADTNRGGKPNPIMQALREWSLWGHGSYFKFVPEEYLTAPIQDRIDLLRGLMDTDGYISSQPGRREGYPSVTSIQFGSSSPQLSLGVAALVRSLGGTARMSVKKTSYRTDDGTRKRCADAHYVAIALPTDINPFHLSRKAERYAVRTRQPSRWITSIEPTGERVEMTCIKVDSPSELFVAEDYIVTHNTMWALQSLGNMARAKQVPSLFFSLEQPREQLIIRVLQQTLGIDREEAERVAKSGDDPRLEELHQLFENLVIFDGVPPDGQPMPRVTPARIQQVITEANLTRVSSAIKIVVVDHLGMVQAPAEDPTVPRSVKDSPAARSGWVVEQLFSVAKATNTTILILQQLPKEVKAGVEFAKDAGYGGSEQTNFSDYVLCIWRPEQDDTLPEEKREELTGQYKIKLAKNRHGAEIIAHYIWDKRTLRIMQPKWSNASGLSDDEQAKVDEATAAVREREGRAAIDVGSLVAASGADGHPAPAPEAAAGSATTDEDDVPLDAGLHLGPGGLPRAQLDGDLTAVTRADPTPRDTKALMEMTRTDGDESSADKDYDWFTE